MKKIYFLLAFILVFQSCEKDEISIDYFPMNIGNYWVYGHDWGVKNGVGYEYLTIDSIFIQRDTLINGFNYYVIERAPNLFNEDWSIIDKVRDSLGYIVNYTGDIIFSSTKFSDILFTEISLLGIDTFYVATYQMEKPDYKIQVPAGNFRVLNYKGTVKEYSHYVHPEWVEIINKVKNNYYAPGIGKVQDSYLLAGGQGPPPIMHRKLLRYNIVAK